MLSTWFQENVIIKHVVHKIFCLFNRSFPLEKKISITSGQILETDVRIFRQLNINC